MCVPVSITGHSWGVLHTVHDVGDDPSPAAVEQLTTLADYVGARIGVLRLTDATTRAGAGERVSASPLMEGTGVGGPAADGAPEQRSAVRGQMPPGCRAIIGRRCGIDRLAEGPERAPDGAVEPDLLGRVE